MLYYKCRKEQVITMKKIITIGLLVGLVLNNLPKTEIQVSERVRSVNAVCVSERMFCDTTGNEWSVDCDNQIGDRVVLVIHDNGTPEVEDDAVIAIA